MIISKEHHADAGAITRITVAASFKNHPISRQTEHFIVKTLRSAPALTLSLVAETGGKIVGHIAFSPVAVSDGTAGWYGMGPVSVLPDHPKKASAGRSSMKACPC